ncbi:MAG: hypothetical protein ACFB2Z_00490 [Maricaulaceae bacterium]
MKQKRIRIPGMPTDFGVVLARLRGRAPTQADRDFSLVTPENLNAALPLSFALNTSTDVAESKANAAEVRRRARPLGLAHVGPGLRNGATEATDHGTDPDPVSILLAVLGGLGSIASIAGYVRHEKSAQTRVARRPEVERALDLIDALAWDVAGLSARISELRALLEENARRTDVNLNNYKFGFGAFRPRFSPAEMNLFLKVAHTAHQEASHCVEGAARLLQKLEDLDVPETMTAVFNEYAHRLDDLRKYDGPLLDALSRTRDVTDAVRGALSLLRHRLYDEMAETAR